MTLENDTQKAKEKFISLLNRSEMFYNKEEIPENESNETAHKLCSSITGAKKYCPVRWRAMQNWFSHAREVGSKYKFLLMFAIFVLTMVVTMGPWQLVDHVVQKRHRGPKQRTGTKQTKSLHH